MNDQDAFEAEDLRRHKAQRAHQSERATLTPIALAESPLANLIASEEWRLFLMILQNKLELAQSNLAEVEKVDRESRDFDHAHMSALRCSRREWAQQIRILEEIMEIPGEILADAKTARERLKEKDRAEEA